jgi:hypothetical protein
MIVREAVCRRTVVINLRHAIKLLPIQATGPAGSFAAFE